jgi:ankyrin repeat protein
MKTILFVLAIFFVCSNVFVGQSLYTSKDKIFKSILKPNFKLFQSEIIRLQTIEKNLDSVYYEQTFGYKNKEQSTFKLNVIEATVIYGSMEQLKYLFTIKDKFPSFQKSMNGIYPYLIFLEEIEKFKFIVDNESDLNYGCKVCYSNSPLLIALVYENYPLANYLLDNGADLNIKNVNNYTALMGVTSADTFSLELYQRLVYDEKASINDMDNSGFSALSYALYNSNIYASKNLLAAGAALSEKDQSNLIISGSVELFRQFKDEPWLNKNINTWRYYDEEEDLEYSLLDYAILSENPKMVKLLIVDYKADVNLFEDIYYNPLFLAIDSSSEEMVKVILEYGDNKNVNKHFLKRAKKRRFSKDTVAEIEALINN